VLLFHRRAGPARAVSVQRGFARGGEVAHDVFHVDELQGLAAVRHLGTVFRRDARARHPRVELQDGRQLLPGFLPERVPFRHLLHAVEHRRDVVVEELLRGALQRAAQHQHRGVGLDVLAHFHGFVERRDEELVAAFLLQRGRQFPRACAIGIGLQDDRHIGLRGHELSHGPEVLAELGKVDRHRHRRARRCIGHVRRRGAERLEFAVETGQQRCVFGIAPRGRRGEGERDGGFERIEHALRLRRHRRLRRDVARRLGDHPFDADRRHPSHGTRRRIHAGGARTRHVGQIAERAAATRRRLLRGGRAALRLVVMGFKALRLQMRRGWRAAADARGHDSVLVRKIVKKAECDGVAIPLDVSVIGMTCKPFSDSSIDPFDGMRSRVAACDACA